MFPWNVIHSYNSVYLITELIHELLMEGGHLVDDSVNLRLCRQDCRAEVERAVALAEARARYHNNARCIKQAQAVEHIRGTAGIFSGGSCSLAQSDLREGIQGTLRVLA